MHFTFASRYNKIVFMIAYMDESGTPGKAISTNDWLVVALIVFNDKPTADALSGKIDKLRLRLGLPEEYEFHRIKDKPAVREKFEAFIFKQDFRIFIFAIKKNRFNNHASFKNIAAQIVLALHQKCGRVQIISDTNPLLVKEISKETKRINARGVRVKDLDSKKSNLIQVADYVANIAGKTYKQNKLVPPKGYTKRLCFVAVTE